MRVCYRAWPRTLDRKRNSLDSTCQIHVIACCAKSVSLRTVPNPLPTSSAFSTSRLGELSLNHLSPSTDLDSAPTGVAIVYSSAARRTVTSSATRRSYITICKVAGLWGPSTYGRKAPSLSFDRSAYACRWTAFWLHQVDLLSVCQI